MDGKDIHINCLWDRRQENDWGRLKEHLCLHWDFTADNEKLLLQTKSEADDKKKNVQRKLTKKVYETSYSYQDTAEWQNKDLRWYNYSRQWGLREVETTIQKMLLLSEHFPIWKKWQRGSVVILVMHEVSETESGASQD